VQRAAPTATSVVPVTDASSDPPTPPRDVVPADPGTAPAPDVDLDAIERDLAAVERALERLSDGTYWTDEITGEPLPDEILAADPTARRA
jgi:hypothetical protein